MKTLVRKYEIEAKAEDIFAAITDPLKIEEYTEDIAEFNPVRGGKFSMWNGKIIGRVADINNNKILLDWKEETWDNYTRVTIKLSETEGKTHIDLIHKDILNVFFSSIQELWDETFFGPLKEYLEEGF